MKTNKVSLSVLGTLVIAALLVIGILKIQQVHAQVDATSSNADAQTLESLAPTTDTNASATKNPNPDATTSAPVQAGASTSGLVEVKLQCSQSYTTDLYDTPSGRLDPYVKPDVATTTDTVAQVIGQQSYTVCHDARGNVHEFPITSAEYAALAIRGTPEKSVMESPDQAALDAFPVEVTPTAAASDTSTSSEPTTSTPVPAVLGASSSATDTPIDNTLTSTSTPAPTNTTAPTTTSTDSTTTSLDQ
jgi:hypothetical protein